MATGAYRLFDLVVARREALTPCLARFTFRGPEVAQMFTAAPDQRVKIFFPDASGRAPDVPRGPNWHAVWKALPDRARPPMRTYTIRQLRPEVGEVDVDFVLHGEAGPASRWALRAAPGAAVQMIAPDRAHEGAVAGYEWRPPKTARSILLIADETALPALAGILEDLAKSGGGLAIQAFIETPTADDRLTLADPPGLEAVWMAREGWTGADPPMVEAARRARLPAPAPVAAELAPVDVDAEILWDRADDSGDGFYAWIAGEAGSVLAIRHHLVAERGLDRRAMNLMGYWRRGRALDGV